MQIHGSIIINLDCIQSLHLMFNSNQIIILKSGEELNLSRTYYEKLMLRLIS
jgi:DNA-binding LytR/AlgR family response regulator